jgi:hypothetical protein
MYVIVSAAALVGLLAAWKSYREPRSELPSPITVQDGVVNRGRLPGLMAPQNNVSSIQPLDTFSGSGALAGMTFMMLPGYYFSLALVTSDWSAV